MELEFQLTIEDWQEFSQKICKDLVKRLKFFDVIVLVLVIVFWFSLATFFQAFTKLEFGLIPFFVGFLTNYAYLFFRGRRFAKGVEPINPNDFLAFQKHNYSKTEVKVVTQTSEIKYKWDHFLNLEESENLLILMMEPSKGEVIPKRAFKDEAQMEEFRKLCRDNIRPLVATS